MTALSLISKYRWRFLALLFTVVTFAFVALRWWQGPEVVVESVVRRDFVQTVVASGQVETPNRVSVGSQITGTVVRIPVAEGQSVKANDVLIELDAAELKATQQQADVAVSQADARLRQLKELQAPIAEQSQRQAQANLDNARATLQRNEDLFKKNFIGEAALADYRKAVELADAQLRSAQKQVETTLSSGSDYALAQSAVIQARAAADAARARTHYTKITAPADGLLISRNVEVGDVVQPGKVLMALSPKGRPQLVLAVDEKNLRLIALGQMALVSADAYPEKKFAARLAYINPGVNAQTGSVEVKLDVENPPDFLKQDMTVSIDIEVARRPGALLVPAAAAHDADTANPWVLRVADGQMRRVPVRLGLRSNGTVEIADGLTEGDSIVTEPTLAKPGTRVRIKHVTY